ncbi:hypothetical protein JOD03_001897 [Chryseomicrobium aureum]|nr:hypothetical protein [Chryseomicrobium aureum]
MIYSTLTTIYSTESDFSSTEVILWKLFIPGACHHLPAVPIWCLSPETAGSKWAIGTEMNLVNRLIADNPHLDIVSLNPFMCPCLTMNRIDLPHLTWVLEELVEGRIVNPIKADQDTQHNAKLALERMWHHLG